MPVSPAFQATAADWRTVLEALKHFELHLKATLPQMEDEEGLTDEGPVAYDHLERLAALVPSFEQQLHQYLEQFR